MSLTWSLCFVLRFVLLSWDLFCCINEHFVIMRSKLLAGVLLWTKFTHPPFVPFWGCNACAFQKLQPALFRLTSMMSPRCFWATPFFSLKRQPDGHNTVIRWIHKARGQSSSTSSPLMFSVSVISSPVLFWTCCCHLTLWILPRLLVWKDLSSFPLSWCASKSRIHTNVDRTRLLKREILVFQPISKAFQMLSSSLLKDALVIAILFLMSAVPPSSLVTLAPRYVNLSTSFDSLFSDPQTGFAIAVHLHIHIPHFLAFSFIPTFAELSSSFVVTCKATVFKHKGEVQANSCARFCWVPCWLVASR